jgi:hypothetical protein
MRPNPTSRLQAAHTPNRLESRWFIFLNVFPDSKFYISEKTENLNLEAVQANG